MNWRYALATIVYCAMIFFESSRAIPFQVDQQLPGLDKVVHAGMYGVLAAIVSIGMRRSGAAHSNRRQFWWPILFALLYGISDEAHQHFVPGRSLDPWDVLANTAGAVLAQYVLFTRRWGLKL